MIDKTKLEAERKSVEEEHAGIQKNVEVLNAQRADIDRKVGQFQFRQVELRGKLEQLRILLESFEEKPKEPTLTIPSDKKRAN